MEALIQRATTSAYASVTGEEGSFIDRSESRAMMDCLSFGAREGQQEVGVSRILGDIHTIPLRPSAPICCHAATNADAVVGCEAPNGRCSSAEA